MEEHGRCWLDAERECRRECDCEECGKCAALVAVGLDDAFAAGDDGGGAWVEVEGEFYVPHGAEVPDLTVVPRCRIERQVPRL